LRGECGDLARTFSGAKNAPRFWNLFLGCLGDGRGVKTKATATTKATTGILRFAQKDDSECGLEPAVGAVAIFPYGVETANANSVRE
jgi:hypothetical protein